MSTATLDSVRVLKGRTKRLGAHYSYKLAGGAAYGMDVAFPDQADFDESRMSLVIPFADGNRRDGVGDILRVEGIDTSRHRLNPIVLFDHGKQVPLPIALAEDRDTKEYTVKIDQSSQVATLNAFFYQGTGLRGVEKAKEYDHALFCEQLFDMGVKRLVRGGSIGYQVLDAYELPPDYQRGTPKGLDLRRVLMLEGSLVVLPANQDTVGKMLDKHFRCCGKPLCGLLVKSLEPYAKGYQSNFLQSRNDYDNPLSNGNVPAPNWRAGQGAKSRVLSAPAVKPSGLRSRAPLPKRETTRTSTPPKGVPESQWRPEGREIPHTPIPSIKDIRLKYRRGGPRRVVKRGAPGRSIIHCRSKDMNEMQQHARNSGLQATWLGTVGAHEKVRLVGDEHAIGEVARQFGRPVKRGQVGKKSLPGARVKRDTRSAGGIGPQDYEEHPSEPEVPQYPDLPKLKPHGQDNYPHSEVPETSKPQNPQVKPGRLAESREKEPTNPDIVHFEKTKLVTSDLYLPDGRTVWDTLTPQQRDLFVLISKNGGYTALMRSVDELFPRTSPGRPFKPGE